MCRNPTLFRVNPNPKLGSFANPRPFYEVTNDTIGHAVPEGEQRNRTLTPGDFRQVMECFAVQYKSFRRLLEAYDTAMLRMAKDLTRRGQDPTQLPSLEEWQPTRGTLSRLTAKQLSMKNMQPHVKVLSCRNPTPKPFASYCFRVGFLHV